MLSDNSERGRNRGAAKPHLKMTQHVARPRVLIAHDGTRRDGLPSVSENLARAGLAGAKQPRVAVVEWAAGAAVSLVLQGPAASCDSLEQPTEVLRQVEPVAGRNVQPYQNRGQGSRNRTTFA